MSKQSFNEFDESYADTEYLNRKLDLSKRISDNRGLRVKLRQELSAYKKVEKTGEKPMDDPKIVTEVLKLKSDVASEIELNSKLMSKIKELEKQSLHVKKEIKEISDLIQRYKVEQAPQIMVESNKLHLLERKDFLINSFSNKEKRLLDLQKDLDRVKKDFEVKNKQNSLLDQVSSWQEGAQISDSESNYIKIAFSSYHSAGKYWREAKFAYDRKSIMPDFYQLSWKALNHAVDAYYLLITQKEADLTQIHIQEKIDLLYNNKIIVSTKLLDSMISFIDRINHGVEVSPTPQYPENVMEFIQKNMASLKII